MRVLRGAISAYGVPIVLAIVLTFTVSCGDDSPTRCCGDGALASLDISPQAYSLFPGDTIAPVLHTIANQCINLPPIECHMTAKFRGGYVAQWRSSNASVATVTAHGVVRGMQPGNAIITATLEGRSAQLRVRVDANPITATQISANGTASSAQARRAPPRPGYLRGLRARHSLRKSSPACATAVVSLPMALFGAGAATTPDSSEMALCPTGRCRCRRRQHTLHRHRRRLCAHVCSRRERARLLLG